MTPAPLLFLPGAGGHPDFWRNTGQRLPDRPKYYFGWPGLGAQPPDPAIGGMDDLVALVVAQLDRADAHVITQSMGGPIAIRAALARPGRVRSLTLAGVSGGMDVAGLGGAEWRDDYRRRFPDAARWISEPTQDLTARIPDINAPALLLWGAEDGTSPPAVGERLQALLPRAELHVIAGADHGMPMTHAAEIAPLIRRHIERAEA